MKTDVATLPETPQEISKLLNHNVLDVLTRDDISGFEKAYKISSSIVELRRLLTPAYMKSIMALQGNRLGFKTDKDDKGGYSEEVVKNCLIEAVLIGVQPFGNQFNIIAGNTYITKEGFGYLLSKLKGLSSYKLIPALPRINNERTSAAVITKIKWTMNGNKEEEELDLPIKMNQFMGSDAVLGKATRKARAWLFNTITGTEVSDGDALDINSEVVASKVERAEEKADGVKDSVKGMITTKTTETKTETSKKDAVWSASAPPAGDPSIIPKEDLEK